MGREYLLSVDIETQGIKTAIFDENIKVIADDIIGSVYRTIKSAPEKSGIAGVACGMLSDVKTPLEKAITEGESFSPNLENTKLYEPYEKQYLEVIDALSGVYKSEVYGIE